MVIFQSKLLVYPRVIHISLCGMNIHLPGRVCIVAQNGPKPYRMFSDVYRMWRMEMQLVNALATKKTLTMH